MVKVGKFLSVFTLSGLLIASPLVSSATVGSRIAFAEDKKDDKKDTGGDTSKDKPKDKSSSGKEDSLDRVRNYLKLAAAKQGGDGGSSKNMTALEIKTAGFFLSNFYTPYVTQVGSDSSLNKEDIVTALKDGAGISESFAKDLGGKISAAMKQAQGLNLVVTQDGGKTWRSVGPATYFDVLAGMTGMMMSQDARVIEGASFYGDSGDKYGYTWYKRLGLDLSKEKTGVEGLNEKNLNENATKSRFGEYSQKKQFYMGLSTVDGSSIERRQVIMDWNPIVQYGGEATPTQALFYRNLQKINPKNTIGASVLSMVRDWSNGGDEYKGIATAENPLTTFKEKGKHNDFEFLYNSSMFGWRMLEDAFGNVLMQTGGHENEATYVVMPGSQNPYMFAKKGDSDSKPKDDDKKDGDKKSETSKKKAEDDKDKDKGKDKDKDKDKERKEEGEERTTTITESSPPPILKPTVITEEDEE